MKSKFILIPAIVSFALATPIAQADEAHHPKDKQEKVSDTQVPATTTTASPGMGMGMMDMNRMQEMHKMMERIEQSDDPAEKQRLMQEHMDEMHKMMSDMHGMMGKGMSGSAPDRQQATEKRMDMMQGMMEQMMEHMMAREKMSKMSGKDKGMGKEKRDHK